MGDRIPVALPEMGEPEIAAVAEVIRSRWVTQGPRVEAFENAMVEFTGASAGVAVSSCTTALHLALLQAGVRPGDEVIVPSMSFIATANSVVHAGGIPVFAEVDPHTFNLDPVDCSERITKRTRALLLVHQLGLPADIEVFRKTAAEHNLTLIEDAACAIGSSLNGVRIGGHGNIACFSFHPRKLVTTGDGGMIMTPEPDMADNLRRLRQHGMSIRDTERHQADIVLREEYLEVAYNYRLTDIQAAIGLVQLGRLDEQISKRQERARWYSEALGGEEGVSTPFVPDNVGWNVQTYAVRLDRYDREGRDRVMQSMLTAGISTRPGVMTAHREPAYADNDVALPISESASDCSLVLPMYSELTQASIERVVSALLRAIRS
ncbi:DegT/DnrJ/EryC1/StrS family aminotransferase [soil metagenome]